MIVVRLVSFLLVVGGFAAAEIAVWSLNSHVAVYAKWVALLGAAFATVSLRRRPIAAILWLGVVAIFARSLADTSRLPRILVAVSYHNAEVSVLLRKDPSLVAARDGRGRTPLHRAAMLSYEDTVDVLLGAGAATEAADDDANQPLHHAVAGRWNRVVSHLTANGARTDPRNRHGESPLDVAKRAGYDDVVRILSAAQK